MGSWQLTGVSVPSYKQHAGCVIGVGAATWIHFLVVVLCSGVSSLELMNFFYPLCEEWIGEVFQNAEETFCFNSSRLVGKVESCGMQEFPRQMCLAAQNRKGACGHLSLSEGTLYGLWSLCRFGSSREASQYPGQYFVCGWGLSRRILYVFGFWLVFLWVLSLKFLFDHDLNAFRSIVSDSHLFTCGFDKLCLSE